MIFLFTLAAVPASAQSVQDIFQSIMNTPGVGTIPGVPGGVPGVPRPPPVRSAETAEIQRLLNAAGYPAGTPDGVMGPATTRAARAFQRARGFPVTGVLTPPEIEALRNVAAGAAPPPASAPAPDIRAVQAALSEAGYDIGTVDGQWGPRSQAALDAFRAGAGRPAGGAPTGEDLALLMAPVGAASLPDLVPPPELPGIGLTTQGEDGESLTALPVVDRGMAFRLAWAGPGGAEAWVAILPPGAMPEPGMPAWPMGPASPATIEAPRAAGHYEIVWVDVRDGSVRARRALEVR